MGVSNLMTKTELHEYYVLNPEWMAPCGDEGPLNGHQGTDESPRVTAKCCMSGDFSGEMVQGILRFLKISLTQRGFRIPPFSLISLKVRANIFRAHAHNHWDQLYFA